MGKGAPVRLVFVGDQHEVAAIHELELWVLTRLLARHDDLALGMEQFQHDEQPVIDGQAATWACELSSYVTRRLLFEAHVRIADGQFDARQKRVLRLIVEHGGTQGISHTQLLWKTRWLSVRERQEVIDNLIATGQINQVRVATKGRSATRYVSRA